MVKMMTREEEFVHALNAYRNIDVYINKTLRLIGISAIKKQIPAKPKKQIRGVYDDDNGDWLEDEEWVKCPSCIIRNEVYPGWDYCPRCGQKLDWSEQNE